MMERSFGLLVKVSLGRRGRCMMEVLRTVEVVAACGCTVNVNVYRGEGGLPRGRRKRYERRECLACRGIVQSPPGTGKRARRRARKEAAKP
jgi:hypothetical protein